MASLESLWLNIVSLNCFINALVDNWLPSQIILVLEFSDDSEEELKSVNASTLLSKIMLLTASRSAS